jgi:4-hydroxybenzoate polyprenyltransferase
MADGIPQPPTKALAATAAALLVATYLTSALLEYPLPWLGAPGTLVVLAVLVTMQVLFATLLYRRIRRSDDAYSVFFQRATLVGLAVFVVITAAVLVPEGVTLVHRELSGVAAAALQGAPA